MSDHPSLATLNALADGELATDELAAVARHLHGCSPCTSRALEQSLLKSATARAGQRHALPDGMRERMESLVSSQNITRRVGEEKIAPLRPSGNRSVRWAGWAVAATLLVSTSGLTVIEINHHRTQMTAAESAALATEVSDQHIATMAANLPPQVLSSDRHTVKPWFQGKIPFSFNLPEDLPEDTKLEGANLAYLHNRPVAQLLYSIGKHRVSVFVQERTAGVETRTQAPAHAGFWLASFNTTALNVIAISDVDQAKLTQLIALIERAQSK
jgi:anti-sigma factor RsiW